MNNQEFFPDNTPIDDWFYNVPEIKIDELGKQYRITDYEIFDDGKVYTEKFQKLIDDVAEAGGGVIVVPSGTYITGALYFKNRVNLFIEENGVLKGSDDISDYPVCLTRIEGETCKYFPALINADNVDGFTIFGKGTIDGNGLKSWKAFWIRREWNPECTNKDEQRPRLIYVSNSNNVLISGLKLQNSHYWTNHFYKCHHVKFIDCNVFSPLKPVPAPSTDAIDIDVCTDVLIKNCYFEVNDDAISLKGGKGPFADKLPENGINERILIENCEFGFCHSCLTCGSESIHNRNIYMRNIKTNNPSNIFWLKMRFDTPQRYEYITIENVKGTLYEFLNINPWNQFFNLKGSSGKALSYAENIVIRNCEFKCVNYFNVKESRENYRLSNFTLENLDIETENNLFEKGAIENLTLNNVCVKEKNNKD